MILSHVLFFHLHYVREKRKDLVDSGQCIFTLDNDRHNHLHGALLALFIVIRDDQYLIHVVLHYVRAQQLDWHRHVADLVLRADGRWDSELDVDALRPRHDACWIWPLRHGGGAAHPPPYALNRGVAQGGLSHCPDEEESRWDAAAIGEGALLLAVGEDFDEAMRVVDQHLRARELAAHLHQLRMRRLVIAGELDHRLLPAEASLHRGGCSGRRRAFLDLL